jgi:PAS domain S-box-containing protein
MSVLRRETETIADVSDLGAIGGEVEDAIERVRVPAYVIDRQGIIRWLNPAARRRIGDARGRHFTSVVAPEERRRAQEIFTRNLHGSPAGSDNRVVGIGGDGKRFAAEVSAVPLQSGGHVIGVFGQALDIEDDEPQPPHPRLTPRQNQVLGLLELGRSTEQIAQDLHLSIQTVRNHVRHILQAFNAHSRLEAVAMARRLDEGAPGQ